MMMEDETKKEAEALENEESEQQEMTESVEPASLDKIFGQEVVAEESDLDPAVEATESAPVAEAPPVVEQSKKSSKMKWYVLHTYSGYEKKVRDQLSDRLSQHGMADKVGDIMVPEESVVEVKSGKKRVSARKFFPGYVLIEMEMNEKLWHVVKETPRITGFLGDAHLPSPLSLEEVNRIKEQMTGETDTPRPKFSFNVGEQVRVTDGAFANFTGTLEEVDTERGKVKVMISIFGRSTPVEQEFSQIEKI